MNPYTGGDAFLATSKCSLKRNRGRTPETSSLPIPVASYPGPAAAPIVLKPPWALGSDFKLKEACSRKASAVMKVGTISLIIRREGSAMQPSLRLISKERHMQVPDSKASKTSRMEQGQFPMRPARSAYFFLISAKSICLTYSSVFFSSSL